MARAAQVIGSALVVLGIAIAAVFVVLIARDEDYRRAALAYAHNQGNVMYEAEFGKAQIRRAFEGIAAGAGFLLALNCTTLIGLGVVAQRVRKRQL